MRRVELDHPEVHRVKQVREQEQDERSEKIQALCSDFFLNFRLKEFRQFWTITWSRTSSVIWSRDCQKASLTLFCVSTNHSLEFFTDLFWSHSLSTNLACEKENSWLQFRPMRAQQFTENFGQPNCLLISWLISFKCHYCHSWPSRDLDHHGQRLREVQEVRVQDHGTGQGDPGECKRLNWLFISMINTKKKLEAVDLHSRDPSVGFF